MVLKLQLGFVRRSEAHSICLRRGRLGMLAHECSVHACVFGRRWSSGEPHACRRAARPPRKLSVFDGFRYGQNGSKKVVKDRDKFS
jgi:hypothetical protein